MRVFKQSPAAQTHQRGIGLIEIMVSVILGLLVIGGVLSLYLGNRWTYRTHQQLGRIQENARFAFELMMRETREAGLLPCRSALNANVIRDAGAIPWWADTDSGMVRGIDGDESAFRFAAIVTTGTGAAERKVNTDALLLLRPAGTERQYGRIVTHAVTSKSFQLAKVVANLQASDVVLVCDPHSSALLQVSTAGLNPIYANARLNCTEDLGALGAGCKAAAKTFESGATLVPWEPAFWYVGTNGRGGSSLYRITIAQGARAAAVEMVPDVSDLQIDYLRTSGGSVHDQWANAKAIGADWASRTAPVAAVRAKITFVAEGSTVDGTPLTRTLVAVAALRNATP